jgi:hypothetical protein
MQEEDKERRFRQTVKKEQAIENPEKITANVTEEKEESNVVVSFWALVGRHDDDVLDGTSSSMEETVSAAFSEQRWLLLGIRQLRVHPAARCHSDSVSQSTWSTVEEVFHCFGYTVPNESKIIGFRCSLNAMACRLPMLGFTVFLCPSQQ